MELVLNWLWQGGVVAIATACVLSVISPSRTPARYCTAWAACLALLALPAMPLVWAAANPVATSAGSPSSSPLISMPGGWWSSTVIPLGVVGLWITAQAARIGLAISALRRARKECRPFPSRREARLAHWLRLSATGRPARLVLSDRVGAAAVFGGPFPMIALAPPLLDHLDDADLDRIIVHEWAHVQRRDDLAQAVQLLVRVIAGWHPAIWWLERQLHLEREVACDEAAAAATGSAKAYAACLATLAGLPAVTMRWLPAVTAAAPSGLRLRIVRILASREAPAPTGWATAVVASISVGVVAFGVGGLRLVDTAVATPSVPRALVRSAAGSVVEPGSTMARVLAQKGPDGTAASSTPVRASTPARASERARAGTATRTATSLTEVATGPAAAEVSAIAVVTVESAHPLNNAAMFASPSGLAPGPQIAPVSGTSSPTPGGSPVTTQGPLAMWDAARNAGKAAGRGTGNAAAATVGVFTRFGRKVATSF